MPPPPRRNDTASSLAGAALRREIAEIASAVRSIKQEIPIQICSSFGPLNEGQAKDLKSAGVDRINHNLNTSEAYHPSICSTHTFQDRLARFGMRELPGSKSVRVASSEWGKAMRI